MTIHVDEVCSLCILLSDASQTMAVKAKISEKSNKGEVKMKKALSLLLSSVCADALAACTKTEQPAVPRHHLKAGT